MSRLLDAALMCRHAYLKRPTLKYRDTEVRVEHRPDGTYIAFRGTESLREGDGIISTIRDVITDIAAFAGRFQKYWMHFGFGWSARGAIRKLQEDGHIKKQQPIFLRGHSLGGGIAQAALVQLAARGYHVEDVTIFGAPRCLIGETFDAFKIAPVNNVRYGSDIVTTVPRGWIWRYKELPVFQIGPDFNKEDLSMDDHSINGYVGYFMAAEEAQAGLSEHLLPPTPER